MSNKGDKRVLIISNVPVTPYSAQGASRGSWFKNWDKDKLAMMTFAKADDDNDFAKHKFTITLAERVGGKIIERFFKPAVYTAKPNAKQGLDSKYAVQKKSFKQRIKVGLGLFMRPKYSARLKAFMTDFKPDVIFSTVADCYGARLGVFLAKKAGAKLIVQQEDNWLISDAMDSPMKWFFVAYRKACLKKTMRYAILNLAISPSMVTHLQQTFGMAVQTLFCADDPKRFMPPKKHDANKENVFVYMGNARPGRSAVFVKLAKSIKNSGIKNPKFNIYSTNAYKEDVAELEKFGFVNFFETPHHNDVPKILSCADVLFLPESFEKRDIAYTNLALSSKVQIYMMANVPILVLASKDTGLMNYAMKADFGLRVTTQKKADLDRAVYDVVNDADLRKDLVEKAYHVALKNHDAKKVRHDIKKMIKSL